MYFIVYCRDKEDSLDLRLANREAHLAWVGGFDHVRVGGPFFAEDGSTMIGSFLIIEADSEKAVREWAADDPYAKAGLFAHVDIHPWKWALGKMVP